ncbi:hypothetical protein DMC30DRAFT_414540 [Rhodotorula diobovata]|uniref:Uncharacterized protein n=1 Tax=Rhodotorula diobovata TaxID=5288 RepID=A0A5C5G2D8_9BASI|nr:hypothetical protein DMC30DRAFT_414540 [Rhodotorula diobovata]
MRWIWDDDTLGVEHAAGMILTAPLPVFMIIRTLASTQRYTTVRRICEADLTHYLSHLHTPTVRERDALTLLQWFQEDGAPPERSSWTRELDEWEREVVRSEGWQ